MPPPPGLFFPDDTIWAVNISLELSLVQLESAGPLGISMSRFKSAQLDASCENFDK